MKGPVDLCIVFEQFICVHIRQTLCGHDGCSEVKTSGSVSLRVGALCSLDHCRVKRRTLWKRLEVITGQMMCNIKMKRLS